MLRTAEPKTKEQRERILSTLKQHAVFGHMDGSLLNEIIAAMRTVRVKLNEAVIKQGEAGEAFYDVSEGELSAYVGEQSGELALVSGSVATYSQGGSFGELALLYDAPRAADGQVHVREGRGTLQAQPHTLSQPRLYGRRRF